MRYFINYFKSIAISPRTLDSLTPGLPLSISIENLSKEDEVPCFKLVFGSKKLVIKGFSGDEEDFKRCVLVQELADSMGIPELVPKLSRISYDQLDHKRFSGMDKDLAEFDKLLKSKIVLCQDYVPSIEPQTLLSNLDLVDLQKLALFSLLTGWDDGSVYNLGLIGNKLCVIDFKQMMHNKQPLTQCPELVWEDDDLFFSYVSVLPYLDQAKSPFLPEVIEWFEQQRDKIEDGKLHDWYEAICLSLTDVTSFSELHDQLFPLQTKLIKLPRVGYEETPINNFDRINLSVSQILKAILLENTAQFEHFFSDFLDKLGINVSTKEKFQTDILEKFKIYNKLTEDSPRSKKERVSSEIIQSISTRLYPLIRLEL